MKRFDDLQEFQGILTRAPQMTRLFELIQRVAKTETSVLVRGETGTGKELVAHAIHALSPRADKPFRAINCAMLTPELLASELFGHVKGAFTGAIAERKGLFELADTGTVFLDEVAEIAPEIQARLLRVLQEKTFVPVGGSTVRHTDVRVISATHQSLREAVAERRFRSDLMYRIRVAPLFLPPLIERQGDIEALAINFVGVFNEMGIRHVDEISDAAMRLMLSYSWPGNVRELRNVIEGAFALGAGNIIDVDDLTPEIRGEPPPCDRHVTDDQSEREKLLAALNVAEGNKTEAAEMLNISRTTLWRKLRRYGLAE